MGSPPDWYEREENERNERRGLEQRAATLIAALLFTIGLVATGAKDLAGSGLAARVLLTIAMAILLVAVFVLAYALTRKTSDDTRIRDLFEDHDFPAPGAASWPDVEKIIKGNITILLTARLATVLLTLGVAVVIAALIVASWSPAHELGSKHSPAEVHATLKGP